MDTAARTRANPIRTIHRALDLGCNFLDTADEYGGGHNERLVGKAIASRREDVVLATKFGFLFDAQGRVTGRNGRPEYVRKACDESLQRLAIDVIDVYYLHRVDPNVPNRRHSWRDGRISGPGKSSTLRIVGDISRYSSPRQRNSSDCGVAIGVFALDARAGAGGDSDLPKSGNQLCCILSARARIFCRRDEEGRIRER